MPIMDTKSTHIYDFTHPNGLQFALGHQSGASYLLFSRAYGMAVSRIVLRLDIPGRHSVPSSHGRYRFWYDPKGNLGIEQCLGTFDFLMSLDPPVLLVKSTDPEGIKEVEVLVPEHRLEHCCENCGGWENEADNDDRWRLVREGVLPEYLCPTVCICLPMFRISS